jgi:hypothetical protein
MEQSMSVELTLLVCYTQSRDDNFAHTIIDAGAFHDMHEQVRKLRSYGIPTRFNCYLARDKHENPCYGELGDTDPYGDEFRMVKAGDLAGIEYGADPYHGPYPIINAAMAYVRAMNPEDWIVLYWH